MKYRLIIKKNREVRSGVITLRMSKKKMIMAFDSIGWRTLYLEPCQKKLSIPKEKCKELGISFIEVDHVV